MPESVPLLLQLAAAAASSELSSATRSRGRMWREGVDVDWGMAAGGWVRGSVSECVRWGWEAGGGGRGGE